MPIFAFLAPLALAMGRVAFTTVRAQMFTLLFLAILLLFLQEDRSGRRWWTWVWPLLVVIWVNLHGGVAAGIGVLAIHGLSQLIQSWREQRTIGQSFWNVRHLALAGIAAMMAFHVSPYGSDYLPYLLRAIRMDRPLIAEWLPIWETADWTTVFLFSVSILLGAYGVLRRGPWPAFEPIALLVAAWLAAWHTRHLSIYAVLWASLVPPMIEGTRLGEAIGRLWRNLPLALVVFWSACGFAGVAYSVQNRFWELEIPTDPGQAPEGSPIYPAGAVEYLRAHRFQGNLMVPFDAGAFVSWHLYPRVKVSNDSRYEVAYPDGLVEEIVAFYQTRADWHATLDRYGTDAILVPRGSLLEKALAAGSDGSDPRWRRWYRDDGYLVYGCASREMQLPEVDRTGETIEAIFP